MSGPEKVLVIIAEGQVRIYHTPGVETACVVDGEDVHLPDDWRDLPQKVVHSMPLAVCGLEVFSDQDAERRRELGHRLMKAPYCEACDSNHSRAAFCPVDDDVPEPA